MQLYLNHAHTPLFKKKKNEQTNQCSHCKQIKTIPSFKCTENLAYVCQIKNRQVFLTLSFPDGVLFSIINFLHIYLDKVKLWTYLFLHQKSSLFSKQMSAIWALAWEEKKKPNKQQHFAFWLEKWNTMFCTEMFHRMCTTFLISVVQSLKKHLREQGT